VNKTLQKEKMMSTSAVTTEVSPESAVTITQHKSIFENAVCLSVSREWPSLTKSLSKDFIKVDKADKTKLHASKDLYNSNALKKLANLEIALDNTLKRYASAPFPLKSGVYILGLDLYEEVEALLSAHLENREKLINEFCAQYDAEVAKAKEFQGDAFDPADYSTGESVKKEFKFQWHYLTMDVAENLSKVGKDILAREQKKMEEVWVDARNAAQSIMRGQFKVMVDHLLDRLTPGEEGKKKIFRNTVLDPMNEFIRTFQPRNISEDSELQNLVNTADQLMKGISPEDLRNNDTLKASVQQGIAQIKAVLDTMIVETAERYIELDDEETQPEGAVVVQ
jgi:hypothetical protein